MANETTYIPVNDIGHIEVNKIAKDTFTIGAYYTARKLPDGTFKRVAGGTVYPTDNLQDTFNKCLAKLTDYPKHNVR